MSNAEIRNAKDSTAREVSGPAPHSSAGPTDLVLPEAPCLGSVEADKVLETNPIEAQRSKAWFPWRRPRVPASEMAAAAAFGAPRPLRRRLSSAAVFMLRLVRRAGTIFGRAPATTSFLLVPAPSSDAELADALARCNWYLGDLASAIRVEGQAGPLQVTPEEVPYLDPALVTPPDYAADPAVGQPHLLVHRITPGTLVRVLGARGAASIVDPRLHFLNDSLEFFRLRKVLNGEAAVTQRGESLRRMLAFGASEGRRALVLGTGPSARDVLELPMDYDLRVMCNSGIRDHDLVEHVRPNVVAFGDHVFHFGPSRYAAEFRCEIARLASKSDCLFAMPEYGADIILAALPELKGRVIPVGVDPGSDGWRWLTADDTNVRVTGNVLTQFMLPIALAVSDSVDVAGCDGRRAEEKYFWTHGKTVQYSDELMQSVFESHIAFFRDNDYRDYYADHCAQILDLVLWAERLGKTVTSITQSYIPALAERESSQRCRP